MWISEPEDEMLIFDWLKKEMLTQIEIEMAYLNHESLWGVPCGPTLTMIKPVICKGL